jgi:RNA polymerase sigma factor (TIGR02999 family)
MLPAGLPPDVYHPDRNLPGDYRGVPSDTDQPDPQATAGLVHAAGAGDREALDALFDRVYGELRRLAHRVRLGRAGETLCTTALVHEAYLKLLPSAHLEWRDRAHFLAVAARAMRQVLVNAAEQRLTEKRGGGEWAVTLDEGVQASPIRAEELLALDGALDRLGALDERQARVVEHRFFAGLTAEETAAVLGVSVPTVHRDWRAARAWLARELRTP